MTNEECEEAVANLQAKILSQSHTQPLSAISKIVNKELERQMVIYQVQLMQAQVAESNDPKKWTHQQKWTIERF
jgi:hypothetical protein